MGETEAAETVVTPVRGTLLQFRVIADEMRKDGVSNNAGERRKFSAGQEVILVIELLDFLCCE